MLKGKKVSKFELPSQTIHGIEKHYDVSEIKKECQNWLYSTYVKREEEPKEQNKENIMRIGQMYSGFFYFIPKVVGTAVLFDPFPVVLCIGQTRDKSGKLGFICINFNFIPQNKRLLVLDKLVKAFGASFFTPSYNDLIKKGKSNRKSPMWYEACKQILKKTGFEFAITWYNPRAMRKKPLVISASDYWKIYFINHKFMSNATRSKINKLYQQNLLGKLIDSKDKPLMDKLANLHHGIQDNVKEAIEVVKSEVVKKISTI